MEGEVLSMTFLLWANGLTRELLACAFAVNRISDSVFSVQAFERLATLQSGLHKIVDLKLGTGLILLFRMMGGFDIIPYSAV